MPDPFSSSRYIRLDGLQEEITNAIISSGVPEELAGSLSRALGGFFSGELHINLDNDPTFNTQRLTVSLNIPHARVYHHLDPELYNHLRRECVQIGENSLEEEFFDRPSIR